MRFRTEGPTRWTVNALLGLLTVFVVGLVVGKFSSGEHFDKGGFLLRMAPWLLITCGLWWRWLGVAVVVDSVVILRNVRRTLHIPASEIAEFRFDRSRSRVVAELTDGRLRSCDAVHQGLLYSRAPGPAERLVDPMNRALEASKAGLPQLSGADGVPIE